MIKWHQNANPGRSIYRTLSHIHCPYSRSNAAAIAVKKKSDKCTTRAILATNQTAPSFPISESEAKARKEERHMDWLKKKKDEAKQAASQAAAKIQNKRNTPFKGEGNVLGGGDESTASSTASETAVPSSSIGFKMPSFGKSAAPPPLTEEQIKQRREQQLKALDGRGNAWEKRVNNARKARLQQEEAMDARFDNPPSPPPSFSTSPSSSTKPPQQMFSNEEVKAREIQNAQAQMGFNPYAVTFSSSTQATSAMNSIGGGASTAPPPPPAPVAPVPSSASATPAASGSGGVYVLLRQEPASAITAAETLIKILKNIVTNPQEEKYRKIRLSNAAIQTKLVAVTGAVDILKEAGFTTHEIDGATYLILTEEAFLVDRIQSAIDRTEVALIQLLHDSTN